MPINFELFEPEMLARIEELNTLCRENRLHLTVQQVASFLGMDAEGLRSSIERGQCPFGFGWQKTVGAYRSFFIPTITFYLWVTNYMLARVKAPEYLIGGGL